MSYKRTGSELMRSGEKFSNAMWEYSWLLQRDGRQDEFADWDKVLDGVVERGYQCLRLDAFPHNIARGKDGVLLEEFDLVRDNNIGWTRNEPCRFNPRKGLVEFMQKCKDRGIYVGLSSWFRPDTTHREREIETPEDYARIWTETLDFLAENDLLDGICWVDLCNEFPARQWAPGAKIEIDAPAEVKASMGLPQDQPAPPEYVMSAGMNEDSKKIFGDYIRRAIEPVRAKYPQLLYTFSVIAMPGDKAPDYSACDVLDVHLWSVLDQEWSMASEQMPLFMEMLPGDASLLEGHQASKLMRHIETSCEKYPEYKEKIFAFLENKIKDFAEVARKNDAILITTEAWASIMYEDAFFKGALGEWDWCKEVDEFGMKKALENGWVSVCSSNFCEPQFEGMWEDVEWHKKVTKMVRG